MKAKGAWRIQKGVRVRYSTGHKSGYGKVVKIIESDKFGVTGEYVVEDEATNERHTVYGDKIIFEKK